MTGPGAEPSFAVSREWPLTSRTLPVASTDGFWWIAAFARTGIFDPKRPVVELSRCANQRLKAELRDVVAKPSILISAERRPGIFTESDPDFRMFLGDRK